MEREEVCEMAETETSSAKVIISFLFGVAIGSLFTFYITRKKMREEKETEIADVTSYYDHLAKADDNVMSVSFETIEEEDYPRDDLPPEDKPYPIGQNDYINDSEYKKETLIYYEGDKVLTDMYDREVIIEDTIGKKALEEFGKYEEDISYARNEKIGYDYEIVLEHKSYAAVIGEDIGD